MRAKPAIRMWLACALAVNLSFAATPTIGIASAIGTFIVNSNQVDGNANLFEGSRVKTGKASSQVFLQSGASLTLGINSAGTIYRDHLVLESGATKVDMNGYRVEAGSYRIEQDQPASQAVVRLEDGMVEVGALAGSLRVLDSKGVLLTRIGSGTASAFQTGGSGGGGQGTANPNVNTRIRYQTAAALLLATTLAGLGLAVDAILQPAPTSR